MTINKARGLGIIYTFIITFICLIPLIYLTNFLVVINKVAETKEIGVDGNTGFEYDLESVTPEEWQLMKEGKIAYLDIIACAVLIFSIVGGRKIGEEKLITKIPNTDGWNQDLVRIFRHSFATGTIAWYLYFILFSHGFFPSFLELIISLFLFVLMTFMGGGGLSVFVGERILRKLLKLHAD